MKKIFFSSAVVALYFSLSACSAKLDGGSGAIPSPSSNDQTIAGPAVEGTWTSDCKFSFGQGSVLSIAFKSNTFTRVTTTYSDSQCRYLVKTQTLTGTFHFSKINADKDKSYEINYSISLGHGVTQFTEEKLVVEDSNLYVSNFYIGDLATVDRTMPLKLQTQGE